MYPTPHLLIYIRRTQSKLLSLFFFSFALKKEKQNTKYITLKWENMVMEQEVVELFETAKKAADAAASVDGGAEESRCVDALAQLKNFPVTYQVLVSTQVGKRLRSLTKHPRKKIQAFASDLIEIWKNLVLEQTIKERKNGNLDHTNSVKVEPENAENGKAVKVQKTTPVKDEKVSKVETVKVEKMDWNGTPNSERVVKSASPELSSIPKCNDALREKVREQLYEALSKVSSEADKEIRVEVNACDPIRVAVSVESAMFEKWGRSNGAYKIKYRSTLFNIKDPKNPDFRRKVLLGHFKPEKVITLSAEEMASDQRQLQNEQIKQKALFDCELGSQPKETTDQFKCGRCGQRRTTYYQMQTRSADEPMTTYVTCVNCNNHWKFC